MNILIDWAKENTQRWYLHQLFPTKLKAAIGKLALRNEHVFSQIESLTNNRLDENALPKSQAEIDQLLTWYHENYDEKIKSPLSTYIENRGFKSPTDFLKALVINFKNHK